MLHLSGFFMNRLHKTVSTIFCYYFDLLSTFKESLFRNILRSQCRNPILVCLAIMFRNKQKKKKKKIPGIIFCAFAQCNQGNHCTIMKYM